MVHKGIYYFRQGYFKRVANVSSVNYIFFWKSKALSYENIIAPTTRVYSLNLQLSYLGDKTRVEFKGNCLKQDEITYTRGAIVNTCIVFEINKSFNIRSYPTLENCLFSTVSLNKNADIDKYKHSGYGIDIVFFHNLVVELVEM